MTPFFRETGGVYTPTVQKFIKNKKVQNSTRQAKQDKEVQETGKEIREIKKIKQDCLPLLFGWKITSFCTKKGSTRFVSSTVLLMVALD